jgi:hypothetical protein
VFDVHVQDELVREGLDTIEEAGDHEALTITAEDVEVTEQSLIMTVVAVYR